MPSQLHEVLLLLFQNRPELAPILLRDALHVPLPAYTEARVSTADLTEVAPTEYRADLVVLLVDDKPVMGIIVEVQLAVDATKRLTWPVYVAGLRAKLGCETCLLVVTPRRTVARWAAKRIRLGPGAELRPMVLGPTGVPKVQDVEQASRAPELAVLSVMAHGQGDVQEALQLAHVATQATVHLDEETRALYTDLIEAALSDAARKAFAMLPQSYQFRGPSYRKGKAEGKLEGKAEGLTEGKLSALFDILDARGIDVPPDIAARLRACDDVDVASRWVRRAMSVRSAADLLTTEPVTP